MTDDDATRAAEKFYAAATARARVRVRARAINNAPIPTPREN